MGIFKNKFLVKLIASICLLLALFNFVGSTKVYAADDEVWGGVLINPIVNLLTSLGDAIMEILHKSVQSQGIAIIKVEGSTDWISLLGGILIVAVAIVVAVAFIAAVGAIGAAIIAKFAEVLTISAIVSIALSTGSVAVAGGIVSGVVVGVGIHKAVIPEDLYLPMFSISAEEIFSGNIALFDVNFFSNDMTRYGVRAEIEVVGEDDAPFFTEGSLTETRIGTVYDDIAIEDGASKTPFEVYNTQTYADNSTTGNNKVKNLLELCFTKINEQGENINWELNQDNGYRVEASASGILVINTNANRGYKITYVKQQVIDGQVVDQSQSGSSYAENAGIANTQNSPSYGAAADEIYTEYLSIKKVETVITEEPILSTAMQLRKVVSTWYFILRNIALLVLMLLLIYAGIRIVIGSTAGEKAKYKERLMDWLVALCLLFVMHYIMAFAVELVEKITDILGTTVNGNAAYIQLTKNQWDSAQEVLSGFDEKIITWDNSNQAISWTTDLAGIFRIQSQATDEGTTAWVGYSLCYFVLVLFTLFFAFTYAKRVLYMAFLTMIAPLVAMTYPIDKITDGKAQAFDAWLKEYIFNLMIQPLHLLLYTVLISSAYTLASESPIYALVAVGFMMPAEKLMRRFFGFEKAKTPGLLGGAAGAALAMTGLQKLTSHHPKGGKGGAGGSGYKEDDSKSPRMAKKDGVDIFGTLSDSREKLKSQRMNAKSSVEGVKGRTLNKNAMTLSPKSMGGWSTKSKPIVTTPSNTVGSTPSKPTPVSTPSATGGKKPSKPAVVATPDATDGSKLKGTLAKMKNSRLGRTISGVSSAYAREMGKKVMKRIEKGRPVRAMARGAAGLFGAAALGATGMALGIASGDPNKVAQYGMTGALAGYGAGSGTGTAASLVDTFSVDSNKMAEEAEMSWYGEDYASHKYDEQFEDSLKSERNINRIRAVEGWSRDEAIEFLDNRGRKCFESGVSDVEDMLAINRVMEETDPDKRIPTIEQAIAATKLKNNLPQKISSMTDEKIDKYRDTYKQRLIPKLQKKHPDWDGNKITKQAETDSEAIIRYMRNLDSAKSGLNKV